MKNSLLITLALFLFSISANAVEWQTDFAQAKAKAQESNKKIIMVFQGSDWCAPCMKLDREIWSTDQFGSYAQDHYVMVKVDFPRRKANALPEDQQAQNAELAEKYNKSGYFPLVVVFDSKGERLGETGYKHLSPEEYIAHLNTF